MQPHVSHLQQLLNIRPNKAFNTISHLESLVKCVLMYPL